MLFRVSVIAVFLIFAADAIGASESPDAKGYRYFVTGSAADVSPKTRGLIVLQGGGDDVDQNYVRMGERGGGGDFVVLRATGDDEYNDYIFALCRCDSVETLVIETREAASDPFVLAKVRNAEALFFAGGDQSNYVRRWKDTPLEDAINAVIAKPAPVGGTSAGMAILGEYSYSAMTEESLTSAQALADPFTRHLTLERDFVAAPSLRGIITDQHLIERDRIGRTMALLARLVHDGWNAHPRAIAADRETAVHVDPETGTAEVFSTADHPTPHAYFMSVTTGPERCERGQALTARKMAVYRLSPGGRFDLGRWEGTGGIAYDLSAVDGTLVSSRGEVY